MFWYALCFKQLALDVFRRARLAVTGPDALAGDSPLAVADRLAIVAADQRARVLGIVPGLGRATALALSPSLCLYDRDPSREHRSLEALAIWALRFTPSVSLHAAASPHAAGSPQIFDAMPAGLLLEVQPSLRYFGGHAALLRRMRHELARLDFEVSIGWAPNPTAAWLLARRQDGSGCNDAHALAASLDSLPVGLLESVGDRLEMLESAGLRRIADLLALPRTGLARRFGQTLLAELDRALGRRADPRRWYEPPARFETRLELPVSVDSAEALGFAARRLVFELARWLEVLQKAARRFELAIEHGEHPDTVLTPGLAEPAWQGERLFALLRERLAATRLPASARALRLRCEDLDDAMPTSGSLFADPAGSTGMLGPLIERLQARLGRESVQGLRVLPDHRPELAWRASEPELALLRRNPPEAKGKSPSKTKGKSPSQAKRSGPPQAKGSDPPETKRCGPPPGIAALPRPLWLFDRPVALSERDGRPYWHDRLTLLAGPERIESGWWDGRPVQRDYFVAEDASHCLLWIYRERPSANLPNRDEQPGWFLHGRFG